VPSIVTKAFSIRHIVVRSDDAVPPERFSELATEINWSHIEDVINDQLPNGYKAKIEQ
jgi:hypothetical protein